jgi:hypothetical protein
MELYVKWSTTWNTNVRISKSILFTKKKKTHLNDNSQQPKIHELFDVLIEIDSLYNNMKILISNNENIDSPISSKEFIVEKYKLIDL